MAYSVLSLSRSLSQKIAHAPSPFMASASLSPTLGPNSIFAHEMVRHTGIVNVTNAKCHFMENYTLSELTESDDEPNEVCAQNWIQRMLTKKQKKRFSVRTMDCIPNLTNVGAFHTTKIIKPDVTVLDAKTRFPVLTVEVYSITFEHTVKKALINAIEQYRLLRRYDSSVESCIGFVFPGNAQSSSVMKVEVKFVDFVFTYSLVPLANNRLKQKSKQSWKKTCVIVIQRMRILVPTWFVFQRQNVICLNKMQFKCTPNRVLLFETTTAQNTGSTAQTIVVPFHTFRKIEHESTNL